MSFLCQYTAAKEILNKNAKEILNKNAKETLNKKGRKFMKNINPKRLLILAFCLVFIVGAVFAFASCGKKECKHENTTTASTATCTDAGTVKTTCNDCNAVLSETAETASGHDYAVSDTASSAATCTADGSKVSVCSKCGDTKTETLAALGHSYAKSETDSVKATCVAAGKDVYKCANCTASYELPIAQTTHSFKPDAENSVQATCTENGKNVAKCEYCTATQEEPVIAVGHNWVTASGDSAVPCQPSKCANCQEERIATASHNYSVTDTATCVADGVLLSQCVDCGDTASVYSPAKGHSVENWGADIKGDLVEGGEDCLYNYTHEGYCSNCDRIVTESFTSVEHNYQLAITKTATCIESGLQEMKCTACGAIDEAAPKVPFDGAHVFSAWTEDGDKLVSTCTVCGETRTKFNDNKADVSTDELKNEVELGTGAVIKMDETSASTVTGNATLSAKESTKDDLTVTLTEEELARLGEDDIIYSITLTENGNLISDFGEGKVTVRLPYTLKEGDDPSRITIFYLGKDGLETIEAVFTMTNEETKEGFVTYETNHFSYYLVGLYTDSELCERFGHEYIIANKAPTCTEAGYYIESCRRCGKFGTRENYAPLGHREVVNTQTSVAPTCTSNGHKDVVCEVCGHAYSTTILATGHAWEVSKHQDATCLLPGYTKYECGNENCNAFYIDAIIQLPHSISKEVKAPTCTEYGYTISTCTTCSVYRVVADFVAPLGHSWNIEAPTCGEGQVCLVCSANGLPATGNHNMQDGKCAVCGLGCSHNYTVKETVAPTCAVGGYTVYVCDKCRSEKSDDFTKATGHDYSTIGICNNCGHKGSGYTSRIEALLTSLISESYAVKLENLVISPKTVTTVNDESKTEDHGEVKINLAELYIALENDKFLVYGHGTVAYEDSRESYSGVEVAVYGDGETLYIKSPEDTGDTLEGVTYNILAYPYDMLIEEFLEEALPEFGGSNNNDNPIPDVSIGGSTDNGFVEIPVGSVLAINSASNAVSYTSDELSDLESMIAGIYEQIMQNEIAAAWLQLIESNSDSIVGFIDELVFSFFDSNTVDGKTTYTFDLDRYKTFYDNLSTMTVPALIDEYYGEGTFESIIEFAKSLDTKTVPTAVTELLDLLGEIGISSDMVFDTINMVIISQSGDEEFDIKAIINSEDMKDLTVSQLIMQIMAEMAETEEEAPTYLDIIAQLEEQLSELVIGNLINAEIKESLDIIAETLFNENNVNFSFTTDAEGKLIGINLFVNLVDFEVERLHEEDSTGNEITEQHIITVKFNFSVAFEGSIPAGADAVKTEYDNKHKAITDAIKAAIAANGGNPVAFVNAEDAHYYSPVFNYAFAEIDGNLYVLITFAEGYTGTFKEYDTDSLQIPFSEFSYCYITDNCTDSYEFTLYLTDSIRYSYTHGGGSIYRITVYVNTVTNIISGVTFHRYETEYTGTLPEGTYLTEEEAPCGSYYGKYYVCSCGDISRDSTYKYHDTYSEVRLNSGSLTCEDGITVSTLCRNCDYSYSYDDDYHETGSEIVEFETSHGVLRINKRACACGYQQYINVSCDTLSIGNGSSNGMNWEGIWQGEGDNYTLYRYNCPLETCDVYYLEKAYNSVNTTFAGSSCYYKYVYEYEFYVNGAKVYETSIVDYDTSHKTESVDDLPANASGYHSKCTNSGCDYEHCYYHIYDSLGRDVEYIYYTFYRGEYSYSHRVYEYLSETSCECYTGYSYSYGEYPVIDYSHTETRHTKKYYTYQEGTCTQPMIEYYGCKICGEDNRLDSVYYGNYGHYWVEADESAAHKYVCEYCGLESDKGNSDISLEDLTQNEVYSEEGSVVIGYLKHDYYDIEPLAMVSFVRNDMDYLEEGATLPAALAGTEFLTTLYSDYYYWTHAGRIAISYESIIASAQLLIDSGETDCTTLAEFFETYSLGVQVQVYDDGVYGDAYEGYYSVIVIDTIGEYLSQSIAY